MKRFVTVVALAMSVGTLAGCASGPRSVGHMAEMEKVREGSAAREGRDLAPQAFARAEQERTLAKQAYDAGDDLAAQIYADRAIAAYGHAFVLARLARATRDLSDANDALGKASDQARQLATSRAEVEREGVELEKKLKVAREALAPAPSGPADAQREAARLVAARALGTEARLLCGSARLLLPDASGLADTEKEVAALEAQLDGSPRPAPIDTAARLRARCLDVLTRARRTATREATHPDALLGEISASAGFDPSRNERGVIITLRDLFKGTALTTDGESKLKELGRVAAAHPAIGVQVVVHDATAPSKAEAEADKQRAETIAKTLIAGGAPAERVKAETAGARAPLVNPSDTAHRARNARVDIVFVSPVN